MEGKDDYLKNASMDPKCGIIRIELKSMIYSRSAVLRAAYAFTGGFDIAVDGDAVTTSVVIKVGKDDCSKKDMEDVVFAFYKELLHSSVEETQARRYADTRNALIGAAMKSIIPINCSDGQGKNAEVTKADGSSGNHDGKISK